jgi:hypothetical protein
LLAAEIGEDRLLMTPPVPWNAGLGRDQGKEVIWSMETLFLTLVLLWLIQSDRR